MSLTAAFDLREALAARCTDRFQRLRAQRLINSMGDSGALLDVLRDYRSEGDLLLGRLLRCRHALVHGNPVTPESVASVRPLSRFRAYEALEFAISSVLKGQSAMDLLDERVSEDDEVFTALRGGATLYEIWRRNTG